MNKTADQLPKREARFPVLEGKSIKVTIEHRGDSPPQEIDAELIDISHGGIEGPNQTEQILAKAMWQAQTPEGHEIGCTFVSKEGRHRLQELLKAQGKTPAKPKTSACKRDRLCWLVLASLLGIAACAYLFLL